MIELVVTFCLGVSCRDMTLVYTDMTLMECMMGGQVIASQHVQPGEQVKRYRCKPVQQGVEA